MFQPHITRLRLSPTALPLSQRRQRAQLLAAASLNSSPIPPLPARSLSSTTTSGNKLQASIAKETGKVQVQLVDGTSTSLWVVALL
jgi:hypothetical protein